MKLNCTCILYRLIYYYMYIQHWYCTCYYVPLSDYYILLMQREEYWYRELCTVFPYGLNDNVKGVGNVSSKIGEGLVVYSLFNRHNRKYRKEVRKDIGRR